MAQESSSFVSKVLGGLSFPLLANFLSRTELKVGEIEVITMMAINPWRIMRKPDDYVGAAFSSQPVKLIRITQKGRSDAELWSIYEIRLWE